MAMPFLGQPLLPAGAAVNRFALYVGVNLAFALLLVIGYAVFAPADPRIFYLVGLFALCTHFIVDIDRLNGRHALLALFMLVYFVSFGALDASTLLLGAGASPGAPSERSATWLTSAEGVVLVGGIMLVLGYRVAGRMVDPAGPGESVFDWSKRSILSVGPILWAVGTYATYTWYVYIIPDTTNEAFRKGLSSIGTFAASAYILMIMMQPLGLLLFAYAMRSFRGPALLFIVIGLVLLQLMLGFVVDIKGLAMLGGILVIITGVLIDGRLPKVWLAAFVVFILCVFPVFQAYRTAIHGDLGLARTAVVANFFQVLQKTLAATDKVNSGRNRAQTFFERSSVKGSIEIAVEKSGVAAPFQLGHTLSPILASFLPKILWPDKPDARRLCVQWTYLRAPWRSSSVSMRAWSPLTRAS